MPRSTAAKRATCRWSRGRAVRLMVPRGAREKIIARVVYSGPVRAPVQEGQKIGMLKVWRGDFVVLEVPLQAAASVGAGSMPQRAFDAASELRDRPVPRRPAAAMTAPT